MKKMSISYQNGKIKKIVKEGPRERVFITTGMVHVCSADYQLPVERSVKTSFCERYLHIG